MTHDMAGQHTPALVDLTESAAQQLWQHGHDDSAWPVPERGQTAWNRWVTQMQAAEVLGFACVRSVVVHGTCIGFCTLRGVDHAEATESSAVECGTWLMPLHRGQGWNEPVKLAALDLACAGTVLPIPDWCLFVLDTRNTRAIASLKRIPLPWAAPKQFSTLLRRRSWEGGRSVTLFAVERVKYLHARTNWQPTDPPR